MVSRNMLGMATLNRARPYFPSDQAYVVAARVRGPEPAPAETKSDSPAATPRPIHAILIADLDLISDTFFELRRRPSESLDQLNFDNVTFVLNGVDTLVGDDSFVALRKRRPRHRTLLAVEEESRKFIAASQDAAKKAEDEAKAQLAKGASHARCQGG